MNVRTVKKISDSNDPALCLVVSLYSVVFVLCIRPAIEHQCEKYYYVSLYMKPIPSACNYIPDIAAIATPASRPFAAKIDSVIKC